MSDFINIDHLDLPFSIIKFDEFNLLINSENTSQSFLIELQSLVKDILFLYANHKKDSSNENIINIHPGGKQAFLVFECMLDNKKVAVKIYKPIVTHLIVHTIATIFVQQNIEQFEGNYQGGTIKLALPSTIALGYSSSNALLSQVAILIQDWVENGEEIYKVYPKDHVAIIRSIIKKLTTDNGLMVDIMSKNWLSGNLDNQVTYIDLILFNPKGKILEQIKTWAKELNYQF